MRPRRRPRADAGVFTTPFTNVRSLREAATRRLGFDPSATLERRAWDLRSTGAVAYILRGMLWRTSPARSRRTPPAGFLLPAQPMLVAKPRPGLEWIHEVKHDGYRLLASKAADRVTLWSRYGTDFTAKLPRIAEAVRSLPIDDALLDGEAVVLRLDGHSDFDAEDQARRRASILRRLRSSAD